MGSSSRHTVSLSVSQPSEPSLQLLNAAMEGDATIVGNLLDQQSGSLVDRNAHAGGKMTPLHLATEGNHENVLRRLLISTFIDVNAQDDLGRTAIFIAAQKGLPKVLQMLQEANANVLLCAQGGYTALHVAASSGQIEVVNLLLGIGGNQEFGYGISASSLEKSTSSKNVTHTSNRDSSSREKKYKSLRGWGSPECGNLISPQERSIKFSRTGSAEFEFGDMSLSPASLQMKPSKGDVLKLLEAKTSAELFTPLHLAASNGHHEMVVSLLESYGQAVGITEVLASVRDKGGKELLNLMTTSIMKIVNSHGEIYSNEDVENDILERALDKFLFHRYNLSPVAWSSIDAMVSYVNAKDCIGRTPLHHATWEQHPRVVEKLLEVFMVNINILDMDGFTPLHFSCWKGDQNVVELLVAHDSKFQMLNPNVAAKQNKPTRGKIVEVKRTQQKLGTIFLGKNLHDSTFSEERNGVTALHYAVESCNEAIVAALASHSDADVFAVATSGSKQSVMEALAPGGEEKSQTPLTLAFSSNDGNILQLLLKSGKRKQIMQELEMLRGYFSRSSKSGGTRNRGKEYHRKLVKTAVGLIRLDSKVLEIEQFLYLEGELSVVLNTLLHKPVSNRFTLLQHAAFAGLRLELEMLLLIPDVASGINTGDSDGQTALHFASLEGETAAVKVLIEDKALRPNEEDQHNRTALQIATEKGWRDIINLLMACPDVKQAVERLYRDRGVNHNAANAILVVAALIASVTFAGWLQPPLGYRPYSNVELAHGDPPGTVEYFAAVQQYNDVLIYWVFNSLSFFFAMATVISGAAEVLPMKDAFIGQEVRMVRGGLVRTSFLLVCSIIFVLVAFAYAGFASLPPIRKYQKIMSYTIISGGWVCISMLFIFWTRMVSMLMTDSGYHKVSWWRWQEEDLSALPIGRLIWYILKKFNVFPENYARSESRRQDYRFNCKRKLVWKIINFFHLDREEYWRQQVD